MSTSIAVSREIKCRVVVTLRQKITSLVGKLDCAAEFSTSSFGQRLSRRVVKPVKKLVQELDRATAWRRLCISPDCAGGQYSRQFEQAATLLPNGVPS